MICLAILNICMCYVISIIKAFNIYIIVHTKLNARHLEHTGGTDVCISDIHFRGGGIHLHHMYKKEGGEGREEDMRGERCKRELRGRGL